MPSGSAAGGRGSRGFPVVPVRQGPAPRRGHRATQPSRATSPATAASSWSPSSGSWSERGSATTRPHPAAQSSLLPCMRAYNETMEEMLRFLSSRGQIPREGSSSREEQDYLQLLVNESDFHLVGEIGFNAGLSSLAFLASSPSLRVVSFDIGQHNVVHHAKEFIDQHYPGRHELVLGDSKVTVPKYKDMHPEVSFDLVFIDGGHDFDTVRADIANLRRLCHPGTGVVIDDLVPWLEWGAGPTKAWSEAIREGLVVPVELFKDGRRVSVVEPPAGRAWALGQYR